MAMSGRSCEGALGLFVLLPVMVSGCGREGRLPTVLAPVEESRAVAPNVDARDEGMLEMMRGRGRRHPPSRALIDEAKGALGGVFTGEQVYYQRWVTFIDVSATDDFGAILGVYLGDLLLRWDFSVSGSSPTGFIAKAQGRDDTDAEEITVTLTHHRGEPVVWTVQRRMTWPRGAWRTTPPGRAASGSTP